MQGTANHSPLLGGAPTVHLHQPSVVMFACRNHLVESSASLCFAGLDIVPRVALSTTWPRPKFAFESQVTAIAIRFRSIKNSAALASFVLSTILSFFFLPGTEPKSAPVCPMCQTPRSEIELQRVTKVDSRGLTKEEQENVFELLTNTDLNGSWLYKDDDFDHFDDEPILDAVVKVYTTRSEPNFSLPWQKMRQYAVTGSGFMIPGRRLLTNAHCVEHHTQVKVKRRGIDTKYVANVLAVGRECDIALLSVDEDEFWADLKPLEFGGLPRLQEPVTVVGYPIGGETISVTSGVVSRVEITSYAHGATELLAVQIDAAINPGNSGGPAFDEDGECVGIAFQSFDASDAENIGYVIPTPVIKHFLVDYERNGKSTGFPSCGLAWQRLENSALRAALQMKNDQKGVLIRRVEPTSPAYNVLKAGDVLMKFDGVPVANEGTVPFKPGSELPSPFWLVKSRYSGDMVDIEVLRNGEVLKVSTSLKVPTRLVPVHIDGKLPSYLIVAGLVFTVVNQPFLESQFGVEFDTSIPVKLLEKATYGMAEHEDEQLVVVSQVLASDVNVGYEDIEAAQVRTFNGMKIRNLSQLAQLADSCEERYIEIELDNDMLVVLETQEARRAIPQILRDHCIPADRSEDLLVSRTNGDNQGYVGRKVD